MCYKLECTCESFSDLILKSESVRSTTAKKMKWKNCLRHPRIHMHTVQNQRNWKCCNCFFFAFCNTIVFCVAVCSGGPVSSARFILSSRISARLLHCVSSNQVYTVLLFFYQFSLFSLFHSMNEIHCAPFIFQHFRILRFKKWEYFIFTVFSSVCNILADHFLFVSHFSYRNVPLTTYTYSVSPLRAPWNETKSDF